MWAPGLLLMLLALVLEAAPGMRAETVEETIPAPTADKLCMADW